MFLKRCLGTRVCQQVPTVPETLQQTLQDDRTILAWMRLPPLKCIPTGFTCGCEPSSAWRMQMGTDSAVGCHTSVSPAHGSPREGVQDMVQKPLFGRRVQLSAAYPQQCGLRQQPEPRNRHCYKPRRFQEQTRRQSLSSGSAAQGCIGKI